MSSRVIPGRRGSRARAPAATRWGMGESPHGPWQLPRARLHQTPDPSDFVGAVPPPKTFLTYPLFDYLIFLCPCQQEEKAGCRGPTEKASFSARSPAHAFCNPKFLRGQKLGTFDTSKGDRWLNMQPKVCTEKIAEPPCWFSIGP